MFGRTRPPQVLPAATLVLALAAATGLVACSDDASTSPASRSDITASAAEPHTEEDVRNQLLDAGIDDADIACAEARTDADVVIDETVAADLREQCEAARQFADTLADNIEEITEDQRVCLKDRLVGLPPETITGFYADALRPDAMDPSKPDELANILDECGIASASG